MVNTLVDKILNLLAHAGEARLFQFTKILFITAKIENLFFSIQKIFKNAEIYDRLDNVKELQNILSKKKCFDLLVINQTVDDELQIILKGIKFRYIVVFGVDISHLNLGAYRKKDILGVGTIYFPVEKYFDIFMPIGPSDYVIAAKSIENKRALFKNLREIYYCAAEDLKLNAIRIEESSYPFSLPLLQSTLSTSSPRVGWYHQQLKQLYCTQVEDTMLDDTVSMCSDLFFNSEVSFFQNNVPIYTYGREVPHRPYFEHMQNLHPQLRCFDNRSAISHHSIFQRKEIKELFNLVEGMSGQSFYLAFLNSIHKDHLEFSGAAEYEIYFNFLRLTKKEIIIREPNYLDTGNFQKGKKSSADYFAYHWYMREKDDLIA
jgi:hypothetical protein